MNRLSPEIPLLRLESSLLSQSSVSTQHGSSSQRTSYQNSIGANSIADVSDGSMEAQFHPCSAEKDVADLEATHPSPTNILQSLDRWIHRRLPEGWRFGATIGAILSFCVLVGNIAVFIIVSASIDSNNGWASTFVTIREGHCSDIEHIQLGIHLTINIVSTTLLGASNYCMQCLSAPTRAEVDKEHQYGRFLDIGVLSLRNLRVIKKERLVCWCLLGLSSVPLHLIYNSTFFVSLTNSSYDIYFASHKLFTDSISQNQSAIQEKIQGLGFQNDGSRFERLENTDCIEAYARTPLPDRRTLVLVSSTLLGDSLQLGPFSSCRTSTDSPLHDTQGNATNCLANSSVYFSTTYRSRLVPDDPTSRHDLFPWICSAGNPSDDNIPCSGYWQTIKSNASEWSVYGFMVDYCISERIKNECKLSMAGCLLTVVIFFNAIKAITITLVVWRTHDNQLITIGDAAASFIQEPDPVTKGLCLCAREDFDNQGFYNLYLDVCHHSSSRFFQPKARRRLVAASRRRWQSTIILVLVGISVILGFLGYGIGDLKSKHGYEGFRSLWELGLGTVNRFTLITGWGLPTSGDGAVILAVLVANLPQALFSMLYLLINGLFTSLSLAAELSRYANRSTPLRVSNKRGKQRSTYFLQIPYRLAIPLMSISAFLHWIISQAIFFSPINARDSTGAPSIYADLDGPATCGYSPLALIITVIAVFAFMVFAIALGRRRLPSGMPVAGSCSGALSAACHCPEGTSELLPVMWGAIPDMIETTADGRQVGHCAFANGLVEHPIERHLYA